MANNKRELFLKRRMRVRNKLKAMAHGRLRLSLSIADAPDAGACEDLVFRHCHNLLQN